MLTENNNGFKVGNIFGIYFFHITCHLYHIWNSNPEEEAKKQKSVMFVTTVAIAECYF
jgi:hypothetical protein